MHTRLASPADFRAFFEREPPAIWTGLVAEDAAGNIVGAGIIYWDMWGRAWGSYSAIRPLPARIIHRAARRVLGALETAGEPAIHVFCTKASAGSEAWLRRLGFQPAPELDVDPNFPVWMKPWQILG